MNRTLHLAIVVGLVAALVGAAPAVAPAPIIYTRWQNFGPREGLPPGRVFCLALQGHRVWAGTENGLAYYRHGRWKTLTSKDGLVQQAVLSLAPDPQTGDLWIGTFGGVSQYSGGVFHNYTQLNSGLVNNVVYGIAIEGRTLWFATAAGVSRFDPDTQEWTTYTQENAPMGDPWGYGVTVAPGRVLVAMWGSGILEYNQRGRYWRPFTNPNQSPEIVLFRNQGLVNDVVSSVSYDRATQWWWAGTYFGLSGYDGRDWHNYLASDSGLISNFINKVHARGAAVWICTNRGLNEFEPARRRWIVYRRQGAGTEVELVNGAGRVAARRKTATAPASAYLYDVAFQPGRLWVATAQGVSLGLNPQPLFKKEN